MTKLVSNTSQTSDSWNTYWQGTSDVGAFTSGGASHPAISAFWEEFFNDAEQNYESPHIIDIASGNGAVVECALTVFDTKPHEITSLDVSAAAVENINKRFPTVKGIVSDASAIPLKTGSFNIVTSQFGVEYAGHDAIIETARLVADGGTLVLLIHSDSGSIHQECLQSLDAIKRTQESQFIQCAFEMFDAGFKAVRGADRTAYDNAAKKLAPAIGKLEEIMKQYGTHVAGDTISRLYNDVDQIHQRIQHYEPEDILNWLQKMDEELVAYAERMSSMDQSAMNSSSFEELKSDLQTLNFSIENSGSLLVPEHNLPMAWVLIAKK